MTLTTETVDARSHELMKEFTEHWEKITTTYPEMTDKLKVFVLWQSQKIAALQVICIELAKQLRCLAELVLDESDPIYDDLIADAVAEQTGTVDPDWPDPLAGEEE
ncbi:MAG: hypothetical protein JXA74_17650 [Anaerolineae bacterium]|nr:hypothetical protein [Anaerolineae bacterium]